MHEQRPFTPNQVVAYNLKRARELRGMTLDETAQALAPWVGETWTRANLSALERSVAGNRPRRFETHDLVIYGLVFDLSPLWFLIPPPYASKIELKDAKGKTTESIEPGDYIDLLFFRGWADVHDRLQELPPEHRGNAREQQAGVLDLYMNEALAERGVTGDTLFDLAQHLTDLGNELVPASRTALNRLRIGLNEGKKAVLPPYPEVPEGEYPPSPARAAEARQQYVADLKAKQQEHDALFEAAIRFYQKEER